MDKRIIDAAAAQAILNSRQTLTSAHIGSQVALFIQGTPTFISADEQRTANPGQKNYFDKYIYNVKANSQEAMARKETKALLSSAMKAESAGKAEEASDLYNEWLNSIQISFNQIADRGRKFESGDQITAVVGTAETKDGHTAIVINDVRYKAPVAVEKVRFNITDLVSDEAEITDPVDPAVVTTK